MADARSFVRWAKKALLDERRYIAERQTEITRSLRELDELESELTPVATSHGSSPAMAAFRNATDIASGVKKL